MFSHLNLHSYYSLGWGTTAPDAICAAVKQQGGQALAITDTNALYGVIRFVECAEDYGLRPIVGAEVTSLDNRTHATILVRNRTGYANLGHIITDRYHNTDFQLATALLARSDGLVIMTDDVPLLSSLKGKVEYLYAELIRKSPTAWNAIRWAKKQNVPSVAVGRSFWLNADDYKLHRLLRAIHLNTTLSRLQTADCAPPYAALCTEHELRESFAMCPESIDRTMEIAKLCDWTPNFGTVYPELEVGMNGKAIKMLRRLAYDGAIQRYGAVNDEIRNRLEYELELIDEKGFAPIFLVVHDIVRHTPITCGRGSAAASLIAYCLYISHVDPIRHNLFFGRFINRGRVDPPDIDIDFPWDTRDEVLDYVFAKYGVEQAAMVSNHVTFKQRGAVLEIAKVYGIPERDIMDVTGKMSYSFSLSDEPITNHPALQDHGFPEPWPEILRQAALMDGIPRYLSVHCGGVVITPGDTANWVPTQMATKGVRIVHWEKDQTEDSGLVKIDLLGNRSLAVIRDALAMINFNYNVDYDYGSLNPLDDPATQEMIARGNTMGVFYIESPATRLLQQKAGVGDYPHVVIHSSLIRPAANRFTESYLRRLKGEVWEPLHPLLGSVLDESYGIMVYQEQVSQVAMALSGFNDAEGDELRKVLSKKHKQKRLADLRGQFYDGARQRGVSDKTIDDIWDMIESFKGYSFCKPHSASYALVSFKSAFLRSHYPAEFMAAVISNQGGFYSTRAYVHEAKRMGCTILPPDVNESDIRYTAKDRWIRVGLQQIKGVNRNAIESVVTERKTHGRFVDFAEFLRRTTLHPAYYRALTRAGCCDSLDSRTTRPEKLHIASQLVQSSPDKQQYDLFWQPPVIEVHLPEFDESVRLRDQVEALGFFVNHHPLDFWQDRIAELQPVQAIDLHRHIGQLIEVIGCLVTSKTVLTNTDTVGWTIIGKSDPSKPQALMCFITFEDQTGLIETVMFPTAYRQFRHIISGDRPYRIFGRVEENYSAVTLTVERVRYL